MDQLNLFSTKTISNRSPLKYIGAKYKLYPLFKRLVPNNLKVIASPFFGSGKLEILYSSSRLVKVYGSDNTGPLVNFWNWFQKDPVALCKRLNEWHPISKEFIKECQVAYFENIQGNNLDKAALYYLCNMCVRDGRVFTGTHIFAYKEAGDYTEEEVRKRYRPLIFEPWILNWYNPYISVEHLDCFEALEKYKTLFLYVDPPYIGLEKYYHRKERAEVDLDHEKLSYYLKKHSNKWILSYSEHPDIRKWYKDYPILELDYYYFSNKKRGSELLILNL